MTINALISFLIYLIVVGVLAALVNYVIKAVPLPEPIARIAQVAVVVVAVLIIVILLLQLAGMPLVLPVTT